MPLKKCDHFQTASSWNHHKVAPDSKPGSLLTLQLANQDMMSKLPTFDGSEILFQGMGEDIIKGILTC